jgi:hypothetical protein
MRTFKGKMLTIKKNNKTGQWRGGRGESRKWKRIHFVMLTELGYNRYPEDKGD